MVALAFLRNNIFHYKSVLGCTLSSKYQDPPVICQVYCKSSYERQYAKNSSSIVLWKRPQMPLVCGLLVLVLLWLMSSTARCNSYSWCSCLPQNSVPRSVRMRSSGRHCRGADNKKARCCLELHIVYASYLGPRLSRHEAKVDGARSGHRRHNQPKLPSRRRRQSRYMGSAAFGTHNPLRPAVCRRDRPGRHGLHGRRCDRCA